VQHIRKLPFALVAKDNAGFVLMCKYPVTQPRYEAVMGDNPSEFKGEDLPVETVSWDDAVAFCRKLTGKSGLVVELPTEAEWEYACRAGTTTAFSTGETISTDQANYNGNYTYAGGPRGIYREKTTPVGSFLPNAWGIHDMHGNVWEWCQDRYALGAVPLDEDFREDRGHPVRVCVLRGGSWYNSLDVLRSACQGLYGPDSKLPFVGFRVLARSAAPPQTVTGVPA